MPDLPAQHYLRIYKVKLAMAMDGTTRPAQVAVEFMERLVRNLSEMDRTSPIRLEITGTTARFTDAKSGRLLADLALAVPDMLP